MLSGTVYNVLKLVRMQILYRNALREPWKTLYFGVFGHGEYSVEMSVRSL